MLEISSTDPPYGGLAVLDGRNSSVSGQGRARFEGALGAVGAVAVAVAVAIGRSEAVGRVGGWQAEREGEEECKVSRHGAVFGRGQLEPVSRRRKDCCRALAVDQLIN